jgi:hypothetical protein
VKLNQDEKWMPESGAARLQSIGADTAAKRMKRRTHQFTILQNQPANKYRAPPDSFTGGPISGDSRYREAVFGAHHAECHNVLFLQPDIYLNRRTDIVILIRK